MGTDKLRTIDSVHVKLSQAKRHIDELDLRTRLFLPLNKIGVRRDPDTRRPIYYVVSVQPVPPVIAAVAGDAIHNMRSALDHLAYGLVRRASASKNDDGTYIYFPIGESVQKYSKKKLCLRGVTDQALEAIDRIGPYKDGAGHLLWILNRLDIIDKHHGLVLAVFMCAPNLNKHIEAIALKSGLPQSVLDELKKMPQLHIVDSTPIEPGYEILIDQPDAEENQDLITRFISFTDPTIRNSNTLPPGLPYRFSIQRPAAEFLRLIHKSINEVVRQLEPFI